MNCRILVKIITPLVLCIIFSETTMAQFFSTGQDPASVRWNQIKTNNFQIIFPAGNEKNAQYLANMLDTVYYIDSKTLKQNPKPISVLLHEHSVISNAYVGWAPKRVELFHTPPQDLYAQPWLQLLSLHEYRHVVQVSKVNQGLTKVLSYIFGQQATAGVVGAYVPFWFLEGDAVYSETYHSYSGRGRVSSFSMPLRAQLINKKIYSYDKAVFGSYKDFVPNHYILGYHLVAEGREKYGDILWEHVLSKVGKNPYMITPFSKGIKNITGLSKDQYYEKTLADLQNYWKKHIVGKARYNPHYITKRSKFYTDYRFPSFIDDETIVALKNSIDDIRRIVMINMNGEEKIIHTPGLIENYSLSYSNSKICWSEIKYDPRWANRKYSDIFIHDIKTNKTKRLARKKKYFAPQLSYDGEKVTAVEVTEHNRYFLIILDIENGKLIKRIASPDNDFIQTPSWPADNKKIIMVLTGDKGKRIAAHDLRNNTFNYLTEYTYDEIYQPILFNDTLLFIGSYNGINNIYARISEGNQLFQLTDSEFGISDPNLSPDGKKLIYSDYTKNGYKITATKFNKLSWKPIETSKTINLNPYNKINNPERVVLSEEITPQNKFKVERYKRFSHLFNFHSWAPLYLNISNEEVNPGVVILSQNKLSTAFTSIGWEYDLNEETGKFKTNFSYLGLYPIFDLNASYGKRKGVGSDSLDKKIPYSYYEAQIETGFRQPFTFNRHQYFWGFQPSISVSNYIIEEDKSAKNTKQKDRFTTVNYGFYYYRQIKTSKMDLMPKWGQVVLVSFNHLPFQVDESSIFTAEAFLYFPGLLKHQGLRIYGGYEYISPDNYNFSSKINYPRGYKNLFFNKNYSFKADYKFPIAYPDLSLKPVLYIKRIKGTVFYDYYYGESDKDKEFLQSLGVDLTTDVHIIRFMAPFEIGLRTIYKLNNQSFDFNLIFAIKFTELY